MVSVNLRDEFAPARKGAGRERRLYRCAICLHEFAYYDPRCPKCKADRGLYLLEQDEAAENLPELISAEGFILPERRRFAAWEWRPAFPKGIPGGTIILLRGDPGAGKTRNALKLGTAIGRCCLVTLEQSKEEAIETAFDAGADRSNLLVSETFDPDRTIAMVTAEGCDCMALDSIQKFGYRPGQYNELIKRFARGGNGGRVVIAISQSNAKGGVRGGRAYEFDLAETSAVIRRKGKGLCTVEVEKNRHGPPATFETSVLEGVTAAVPLHTIRSTK